MVKEQLIEFIREQPDDSSAEEIVREIVFANLVERGLRDSQNGRVMSNDAMQDRIKSKWK